MNGDRSAFERFERPLEPALDGFTRGLTLPADEPRPVVGDGQLERTHGAETGRRAPGVHRSRRRHTREPGLVTGEPAAHSGQTAGSYVGSATDASA